MRRRDRNKNLPIITLRFDKFVSGGQVIGHSPEGQAIFAWGVLPGELAEVQLTKRKKDYAEGVAVNIIEPSTDRITPREQEYLSTSPWQILEPELEDEVKLNLLSQQFQREGIETEARLGNKTTKFFNYRNKMEYCFWADEMGLRLSLRRRGTNQKIAVNSSALAQDSLNNFSEHLISALNKVEAEGRQLKSVIIRCSGQGSIGAALFVKDENFQVDQLIAELEKGQTECEWGIEIYFSNPKSPASVATKLIASRGKGYIEDELGDNKFKYSALSFFQGNISVYSEALSLMADYIDAELPIVDMFSGVGSIGLSLIGKNQSLSLIEIDKFNTDFAKINSAEAGNNAAKVITSSSEGALEYITKDINLILDPPRAGLHKNLSAKICEIKPKKVLYLSCNPATQARDVKILLDAGYKITLGPTMFNFFPRTPHIESLVVLESYN
jgi:23S rRNA (uracil1939-C5)-methyltransferase